MRGCVDAGRGFHGQAQLAVRDFTDPVPGPNQALIRIRCVRVFGRACFVGEGGSVTLDVTPDIIHRQLTLYGSWTFSVEGLAQCARYVVEHGVPLQRIITNRFGLEQAEQAYREFDSGIAGKCVFVM
jgi:threonine dehydrogenase-like Zn-dependent dehydrogenase